MSYKIDITPTALQMLKDVQDRRMRGKIVESINGLAEEPEKKGKPLAAELDGYRSLRAVGQRYRIIYRVDSDRVIVLVVGVGIRKEGDKRDIYALAKKLIQARLLEPEKPDSEKAEPEETAEEAPEDKPEDKDASPS